MDRLGNSELDERCWDIVYANDCRSIIATALAEKPFDEEALHRCVDCYVGAARIAGRSTSDVIVALTELVERTDIAPASVRHALIRHVIPWCVEAYFGHIGRDAFDGNADIGQVFGQAPVVDGQIDIVANPLWRKFHENQFSAISPNQI